MTAANNRLAHSDDRRPGLLYVVTSSMTMILLRGQLNYFRGAGYDVTVVSSPGEELAAAAEGEGVRVIAIPIARKISPWRDLVSLWRLWCLMRQLRPTLTNVGTPKAGLLGGIAAVLAGVPCRLYLLRGLRCETVSGFKQRILEFCEKLACLCAHRVICASESLQRTAVSMGIMNLEHSVVLGSGSSNGVDVDRLALTHASLQRTAEVRASLAIPHNARIVGFVGRFTRDKGLAELVEAWSELSRRHAGYRLLLVGDFEEGDPLPEKVRRAITNDANIVCTGFVRDTTPYFHLMDVLAFPSHREGFPNVVLEAYSAGKPVVATLATGTVDAVIDGVTGMLVAPRDPASLARALEVLLDCPELAERMGRAGRARVLQEFRRELVWERIAREYLRLLQEKDLPLPSATSGRITSVVSNSEARA